MQARNNQHACTHALHSKMYQHAVCMATPKPLLWALPHPQSCPSHPLHEQCVSMCCVYPVILNRCQQIELLRLASKALRVFRKAGLSLGCLRCLVMGMQVRQYLMEGKRQDITRQAIINLSEDALWNLMSACSNTGMPLTVCILPLLCCSFIVHAFIHACTHSVIHPSMHPLHTFSSPRVRYVQSQVRL